MEDIPVLLSQEPAPATRSPQDPPVHESTVEPTEEVEVGGEGSHFANEPGGEALDIGTTAASSVMEEITEAQRMAGLCFVKYYNRVLSRRRAERSKRSTSQKTCDSFFKTCIEASTKIEWPHKSPYKTLFLGLVPHLLTCVNALESYSSKKKTEVKKRWAEKKEDTDVLNAQRTEITYVARSKDDGVDCRLLTCP